MAWRDGALKSPLWLARQSPRGLHSVAVPAYPLTPGGRSLRERRAVVHTRRLVCTVRTNFCEGENPVTSTYTSGGDLVGQPSYEAPLREHYHHPG